jgi:hypothetical protein
LVGVSISLGCSALAQTAGTVPAKDGVGGERWERGQRGEGLGEGLGKIERTQWRVWLEARNQHAAVSSRIEGATQTEWVAGWRGPEGDHFLSFRQFLELGGDWAGFRRQAVENAAEDLKAMGVEWVRNEKRVVEYGVLRSEKPWVSAVLVGAGLWEQLEPVLGERVLVVVPHRSVAYFFPVLAGNSVGYGAQMLREYYGGQMPVSLEVFEWGREGIRAVGVFEE